MEPLPAAVGGRGQGTPRPTGAPESRPRGARSPGRVAPGVPAGWRPESRPGGARSPGRVAPGVPAGWRPETRPGGAPSPGRVAPGVPAGWRPAPGTGWPTRIATAYCRYVIAAVGLGGTLLFIVAGLIWTARLVHVGSLDAAGLAEKIAVPEPVSALDWPELHLRSVVPQPGEPS